MDFSLDTYKLILEDSSEVQVYIMLNGMSTRLLETNVAVQKGLLSPSHKLEQDIADLKDMIRMGVDETARFGVIDPLVVDDQIKSNVPGAVIYSPSAHYWKWYSFWDGWKNGLTAEQWAEVEMAIDEDLSILPHMPLKSWLQD